MNCVLNIAIFGQHVAVSRQRCETEVIVDDYVLYPITHDLE